MEKQMARLGYCRHGWRIDCKKTETIELTLDGIQHTITPPQNECPYCVQEEKARKDQIEYQQMANINLVRLNFLRLLKEDPDFLQEVKELLK